MTDTQSLAPSKVPEVTLGFWIIKIFATTLGEVGGNAVTMLGGRANRGEAISAFFILGGDRCDHAHRNDLG